LKGVEAPLGGKFMLHNSGIDVSDRKTTRTDVDAEVGYKSGCSTPILSFEDLAQSDKQSY
jgi:hypothetical protein